MLRVLAEGVPFFVAPIFACFHHKSTAYPGDSLMTTTKISLAIVALVLGFFAVAAEAGTISLNDVYNGGDPFVGDNYMWIDVTETNGGPEDPAFNFYQDPLVIDDSLTVNPTNFRVGVAPGPGLEQLDSQLEMVIMANEGATIPFISFAESGDFEINGIVIGDAIVSAEVDYFFQILEGDSAGMAGTGSASFQAEAAPSDSGLWTIAVNVEMPANTTKVRFEFDNRLTAQAFTDISSAFIAKKLVKGVTITIPEPTSAFLWLIGLSLLAMRTRR
jgi:hypothetical protein